MDGCVKGWRGSCEGMGGGGVGVCEGARVERMVYGA